MAAVAKGESEAQPLWDAPVPEELYDLAADRGETDEPGRGGGGAGAQPPEPRLEPTA